jgi:hypothetical protein
VTLKTNEGRERVVQDERERQLMQEDRTNARATVQPPIWSDPSSQSSGGQKRPKWVESAPHAVARSMYDEQRAGDEVLSRPKGKGASLTMK